MSCSNCGAETFGTVCSNCGTTVARSRIVDVTTNLVLASWWHRFGATFSDNLILLLPTLLIISFFSAVSGYTVGYFIGSALQGVYMVKLLAGGRGQTIGNRVAATRVRDAQSGQAITTKQALKRWGMVAAYSALSLLGGSGGVVLLPIIFLVDCLWPLFDARKQTLHDKFANTIVVLA